MLEYKTITGHTTVYKYANGVLVKAWVEGVPIEDNVWTQVSNIAAVPGVERIAIMPDAHVGNGACVGSAILTRDIVIPAAVGVDIGCGMIAAPLNIEVQDVFSLEHDIRLQIEKNVPVGRTDNGGMNDRGSWGTIPPDVDQIWNTDLLSGYVEMTNKYPGLAFRNPARHLGTLGTGNHFIELQYDTRFGDESNPGPTELDSPVWIMLHSGSRGIGNHIGQFFISKARKEMERWHITLPDPELAFLPVSSELGQDYLECVAWAQRFAWQSRLLMLDRTVRGIQEVLGPDVWSIDEKTVHVHHNYIAHERHFGKPGLVTRKGAINAALGNMGIIPSSMGGVSHVTSGLGNLESLNTSSHGAGRVMSRTVAKKTITEEDHLESIKTVECRKDTIDESPAAYKSIDAVMAAQSDLTQPVTSLKQFVCVKG